MVQILDGDHLFLCQITVLAHDHAEDFLLVQGQIMIGFFVKIGEDQREVEQSAVKTILQILGVAADDVQPDIGVLVLEVLEHRRDAPHGARFTRADAQTAGDIVFDLADLALGQLHQLHHLARALAQNQPFFGQLDPPSAAEEQGDAELFLQLLELA